jgi:hypothetical protein
MKASLGAIALGIMLVSFAARAQDAPKPIEVKGHSLGETVDQFFAIAGSSHLVADCQSIHHNRNKAKKLGVEMKLCDEVLKAESGARVEATDPKFESPTTPAEPLPPSHAVLDGKKLVSVTLVFTERLSALLPDLTAKYGSPESTGARQLTSGYGATFDTENAAWKMPDGSIITAIEEVKFGDVVGEHRYTSVAFLTKEEAARAPKTETKNPNRFN